MNRQELIAALAATLIRGLCRTLRFHVEDHAGLGRDGAAAPVIYLMWHNRILVMPFAWERFFPHRSGTVLTSASRDGGLLAGVVRRFGIDAVRGSSSRGGAAAVRALAGVLRAGGDVAITPDGPRGPRYQLQPGAVQLARTTGAPLVPIAVHYARFFRVKSWDRFRFPLPFSRVTIRFCEPVSLPKDATEGDAVERDRARLERLLVEVNSGDSAP